MELAQGGIAERDLGSARSRAACLAARCSCAARPRVGKSGTVVYPLLDEPPLTHALHHRPHAPCPIHTSRLPCAGGRLYGHRSRRRKCTACHDALSNRARPVHRASLGPPVRTLTALPPPC